MDKDSIISQSAGVSGKNINAICLGSGRFLRSVLVPFLSSHLKPAVFQTRGRTFLDSFRVDSDGPSSLFYPVDTIQFNGSTTTDDVEIYAAGTMGTPGGKSQVMKLLSNMDCITVIGVGVTEAGLASADTQCMVDLTEILYKRSILTPNGRVCIVNTDNVPNNGDVIRDHILKNSKEKKYSIEEGGEEKFLDFVQNKVAFLNSMVDRITSSRAGSNGLVPLCEPLPNKALVICDPGGDLPSWMSDKDVQAQFGVKIRRSVKDLHSDIALKLRVANGTHTAVAHAMALLSLVNTESLSSSSSESKLILKYLDSLYESQILKAAIRDKISAEETDATWDDWRQRLKHPHFGLSTFFITQNGAAKGGIRLGPTIKSLVAGHARKGAVDCPLRVSMALAVACILRFLTPVTQSRSSGLSQQIDDAKKRGVYVGWLDGCCSTDGSNGEKFSSDTVTYADGLRYNLSEGWYEFRCNCPVKWKDKGDIPLPRALAKFASPRQPCAYIQVVRSYLLSSQGGDLQTLLDGKTEEEEMLRAKALDTFISAVSTLYARMVSGDSIIDLMQEMMKKDHIYTKGFRTSCDGFSATPSSEQGPLYYSSNPIPSTSKLMKIGLKESDVSSVVYAEVKCQQVIDLHTHLLPPSHGALCLWGIDELLTYHYLVAEYFMTAPSNISPEGFYAMNKREQADLIWDALFIQRSPISEATRGVLTTLVALGLEAEIKAKDLASIRKYYDAFRDKSLAGTESFVDKVYQVSGVRYAIMTNIPFDANEAQHWKPKRKDYPNTFRSALRVDPLLAGDTKTVFAALKSSGYGTTLVDARQYLHDWCDTMNPEYLMASTPHDFTFVGGGGTLAGVKKAGLNEGAMKAPFAFAEVVDNDCDNCEETDNVPSIIDERSDLLTDVLMPVCEERNLPLALKIGAHRGVNPQLLSAGDGMVAFADTSTLARLCGKFPKVRFLATFLSRVNQHEACVLASKFRNLHIYGCWWYCNNPSIIEEITKMRVEMLGSAFTAQHSDARIMDQLIYKWAHSRAVIARVLIHEYQKSIISSGWKLSREDIRRDTARLFGGAYEEFMRKG